MADIFKNTAAKFIVFAFDSTTNLPKSGDAANITAYVSKDYGAVTVLADTTATELDATNCKGYYIFDSAQAETNADCLLVSAKSSTANIVVIGAPAVIFTRPTTGYLAPATLGRTLVVDASGLADANTVKIGPTGSGTAQTARDVGASVLLSTGTGTGQLDFTSGVVKANLAQILGTALTETSGQIAAGFKKFFNIASPAATMDHGILVDTATSTTNAPTVGDLTATMKTSVTTAATAATPTAAAVTAGVTVTTNNDKTGYAIASGGIGSGAHAAAELNNIADGCLDRRLDLGTDSGGDTTTSRTWRQALRSQRNKVSIAAGIATVTKENDSTASWTAAVATTAGNPISSIDPT